MKNKYFAVIDTNVIVSALISTSLESNPVKVFRAIIQEQIVPLYNDEILDEYRAVLSRVKFHLDSSLIETVLKAIITDGLSLDRTQASGIDFPDPKDIVFYEVALSRDDSYLVTGNIRHFPAQTFVITPAEMVRLLETPSDKKKE
jgi:uncharacterized protein